MSDQHSEFRVRPSASSFSVRDYQRPLHRSSLVDSLKDANQMVPQQPVVRSPPGEEPVPSVRRLSRRQHIENEIVTTEEKYVDALQYLIDEYEKPLRAQQGGIFKPEELDVIFGDINILQRFNVSLLADFLRSRHPTKGPSGSYRYDTSLASIIRARAPFMKVYTAYLKSMEQRLAIVKKRIRKCHEDDTNPNTSIIAFQRSRRMTLEALLIQPVQRLPRYKLLLADLLDATDLSDADYSVIVEALELVSNAADHCNAFLTQIQGHVEAWGVHEEWGKLLGLEYSSSRKLLRRGSAGKRNRRGNVHSVTLLLFSDFLVYGERLAGSFRMRRKIPLCPRGSVTFTWGTSPGQIVILSDARSFVLDFPNQPNAQQWFDAFAAVMDKANVVWTAAHQSQVEYDDNCHTSSGEQPPLHALSRNSSNRSLTSGARQLSASGSRTSSSRSLLGGRPGVGGDAPPVPPVPNRLSQSQSGDFAKVLVAEKERRQKLSKSGTEMLQHFHTAEAAAEQQVRARSPTSPSRRLRKDSVKSMSKLNH